MKNKETLEEVAKSHAIYELENNYKPTKESFKLACKRNFIRGAKWQQEQMYSEEEVIYLLYSLKNYLGFGEEVKEQEWFKQFKKK